MCLKSRRANLPNGCCRSYMIISNSSRGLMVTGRMCPQSVCIKPSVGCNGDLTLEYPGQESITVTSEQRQCNTIVRNTK